MEKVFFNYLNPAGRAYSEKIGTYRRLKYCNDQEEIIGWLEEHLTGKEIKQLLSQYMLAEFNYQEPETAQRIRITEEQFEQFFRIIKPQSNPARLRKQMTDEIREELKKELGDGTDDKTDK